MINKVFNVVSLMLLSCDEVKYADVLTSLGSLSHFIYKHKQKKIQS